MSNSKQPISFDNTAYAFAYKTNSALRKAKMLFSLMGNPLLIKWGLKIMPLAIKYNIPFTKTILKKTIFSQFVGGETLNETKTVVTKLDEYDVAVILDYGVEGESGEAAFDHAAHEFINVVNYAAQQKNIPYISIKITGLARFSLLENIDQDMQSSGKSTLMKRYEAATALMNETEDAEWQKVIKRIHSICEAAFRQQIAVLVDAEESWIQEPVDAVTMLMMDVFNKERAVVYNTIQLYRHDRLRFLECSIDCAKERNFLLGAKLVRGAYMEKERARAIQMNYPSPIQKDKGATDNDYNAAIDLCFRHADQVCFIIASHNEHSNLKAAMVLNELSSTLKLPQVHFSQLYGMSDNITFNLAKSGLSVSKYLPFGPIKDVIPYLMRRAQENSSVAGQTSRELGLIKKEMERRSS